MPLDTEKEIKRIISEISGYEEDEITPDVDLVEKLEVDSIKAIEIAVAIEKKFKISVRDEDIATLTTLNKIISVVQKLLEEKEKAS